MYKQLRTIRTKKFEKEKAFTHSERLGVPVKGRSRFMGLKLRMTKELDDMVLRPWDHWRFVFDDITMNDEPVFVDYTTGIGHRKQKPIPPGLYKYQGKYKTILQAPRLGDATVWVEYLEADTYPEHPSVDDVLYALISGSDSLEVPFEQWAKDFGYNPDSISGKAVYDACQLGTFKLKRIVPQLTIEEMRKAFEDY